MSRLRWSAAGTVALALGLLVAWFAAAAVVPQSCPWYDDEGPTADPGSPYAAVLCGSEGDLTWALAVVGLVALSLALVVAVLVRNLPQAPWVALGLLAAGPLVLMVVLISALHQGCLGGDDGTERCATNREQL